MLVLLCGYVGTEHSLSCCFFWSENLHNLIHWKGGDLSNLLVKGNVLPNCPMATAGFQNMAMEDPGYPTSSQHLSDHFPEIMDPAIPAPPNTAPLS